MIFIQLYFIVHLQHFSVVLWYWVSLVPPMFYRVSAWVMIYILVLLFNLKMSLVYLVVGYTQVDYTQVRTWAVTRSGLDCSTLNQIRFSAQSEWTLHLHMNLETTWTTQHFTYLLLFTFIITTSQLQNPSYYHYN